MTDTIALIQELQSLNIELWADGDRLRFNAPKGAMTSEIKDRLRETKAALLAILPDAPGRPTRIPKVPREGHLPLSFAQQRLWYLDRMGEGRSAYNIPLSLRIKGRISPFILSKVLLDITNRHESLHTTFITVDDQPCQVISPHVTGNLRVVDLSALSNSSREAALRTLAHQEARRPFNLATGPLLRCNLLKIADEECQLLLTMHHIISDGWSMGVLTREISHLCGAYMSGRQPVLAPLTCQYPDYASWQRRWLAGAELEKHVAFWKKALDGAPQLLNLPTDFKRPAHQSFNGARIEFDLPADLAEKVRSLGRDSGTTLFMTLLAAFKVLLLRYSGQDDLSVGTPIANRTRKELEPCIGFFVNTLVLRTCLDRRMTFRQLIETVRQVALDAYGHQDLPFEKLVEVLRPERNLSYSPLFQVMFIVQNAEQHRLSLPNLSLERQKAEGRFSKFDMTLSCVESRDGLSCTWEYCTDLFREETLTRMIAHFRNLITAMTEDPDRIIGAAAMIGDEERETLVHAWNGYAEMNLAGSLKEMIEARVAETPDEVVLTTRDKTTSERVTLTYAALNRWANHIASQLAAHGVGPGVMVGLCAHREPAMLAGMLGVVKSGGAYVSLDPKYPRERLEHIIGDIAAPVHLCQTGCEALLPVQDAALVTLTDIVPTADPGNPTTVTSPDQPAYVLFTSGSTGKPKGVVITQRSVLQLVYWADGLYGAEDRNGVLAGTSINFDLSVYELLVTLCLGGHIVLVENLLDLLEWEDQPEISLINTVPSAMKELIYQRRVPESVRVVNLAGEPLPGTLVRDIAKLPNAPRIYNLYGPSEDTTYSTGIACAPDDGREPTIGLPIPHTQAYVLDYLMNPTPIGVPGELYLGGEGLARGYLNKPAMTAASFVPDPFHDRPGKRLYRTGDLVRRLAGGSLEFNGRIDNQVKVRGFRIELGEIETVLRRYEIVDDAAVLARQKEPGKGNLELVAFVSFLGSSDVALVRDWLNRDLPEYMVPSLIVALDELPLTPNGKINRRALATMALDKHTAHKKAVYVAPRTETETTVIGIWTEVLETDPIGAMDNFFELGGHSLLVTRVMSKVRDTFGVNLPLSQLFEYPTVAELSRAIDASSGVGQAPMPLVAGMREDPAPLSYAQRRLWFINEMYPKSPEYNISIAVHLEGRISVIHGLKTFDTMIRRHENLRTSFPSRDGRPYQKVHEPFPTPSKVIDLRILPPAEALAMAQKLASQEMRRPFDLVNGPLLRFNLIRLAEERHVLTITLHHIISDAWSLGVFRSESFFLYRTFLAGGENPLPELPVQYSDFASWQRKWLEGGEMERQLAYWKQALANFPKRLELPADNPDRNAMVPSGHQQEFCIDAHLTAKIRELAGESGATLFMTLVSTYMVLLHVYSGQNDILVGSPIANRTQTVLEKLIGFFVNTLVLRANFDAALTFRDLLLQVRRRALDAYAHQDLPFENLVKELQPRRSLSHSPIFRVMFILQIEDFDKRPLPGIEMTTLDPDHLGPKFDLILTATVSDDILRVTLSSNANIMGETSLKRMAAYYQVMVREIVENPERPLSRLSLLAEEEWASLLGTLDQKDATLPVYDHMKGLLEDIAARHPARTALAVPGTADTDYATFNARINRLAAFLLRRGAGPDTLVALALTPGPGLLSGMLAVLKTGAGYVVLSPALDRRDRFMLGDAGVDILLTDRDHDLPSAAFQFIDVRQHESVISECSQADPDAPIHGQDLAYIHYAFGRNRKPKGICLSHQGLAHHVATLADRFNLGHHDRVLYYPESRCAPADQAYPAFAAGAALVCPAEPFAPLSELTRFVMTERISVLNLPVTLWQAWLEALETSGQTLTEPPRLVVVASAKRLPNDDAARQAGIALHHLPVFEETDLGTSRALVLDRFLRPVPVGVYGELFLGGRGVPRGYRGDAAQTAANFLPDPFADHPCGGRLFGTGQRARMLSDAGIELAGHVNHQVLYRGYPVDLSDVEAALCRHEDVAACAAVLRPGTLEKDQETLAAFIVTFGVEDIKDVRRWLKHNLPDYMTPSQLVRLETLPRTDHGVIDYDALAAHPLNTGAVSQRNVPPRNATEEILLGIWCDVLQRDFVGVMDNFFEIGGHSLLATRIMARLNETFKTRFQVSKLFENPTIEELAGQVDTGASGQEAAPPLESRPHEGPTPLSFAQQRLWFIDRLAPGSAAYNMPAALRLKGRLDTEALEKSLAAIIARHEILRTVFRQENGAPVQVVLDQAPAWRSLDLTGLAPNQRDERVGQLAAAEAASPFDLTRGPLVRVTLVRFDEDDFALLFTMHHIISDGWSMGILVREMAALYRHALAQRSGSPLKPLPLQYRDFSAWQQEWLAGETLQAQIDFWKDTLAGIPEMIHLPTDRPRPTIQTFRGDTYRHLLSPRLQAAVNGISRQAGATVFMTLLSAFGVLLGRLANQTDIVVGSPVANRSRSVLESLIGFFVNTLPLRIPLSGNPSFSALLQRVKRAALDAYAHQDVPFEKLVEELQPERSLAHSPIYQVMFSLQNITTETISLPDVTVHPVSAQTVVAKFDLTLSISEGEGLACTWEFNTDLFDRATIAGFAGYFERLLAAVTLRTETGILDLPLLTEQEQETMLAELNGTETDTPPAHLLHEPILDWAAFTPDTMAILAPSASRDEWSDMTYAELLRRSRDIAVHLTARGIGPGDRVGLLLERDGSMIAAMLGVLQAGAAFIPLEPATPKQRLAFILEDSGAGLLLTRQRLAADLPEPHPAVAVLEALGSPAEASPLPVCDSDFPAYVLYTSGSTGQPKGVVIPHRGVAALFRGMAALGQAPSPPVATSVASFSFDVSIWEVFQPLSLGGTLHLVGVETTADPRRFADYLLQHEISQCYIPPGILAEVVSHLERGSDTPSLRYLLVGVEPIPQKLLGRFQALIPDLILINGYGPTEATVCSLAHRFLAVEDPERRTPIGRPLPGYQAYLVNENLHLVPPSVEGELLIGGSALALGYLNRPDITATQFVPNPFRGHGERLYRSGDLACLPSSGEIEFRGRRDNQVKVRGYRVELGEIEMVLERHPDLREAAVILHGSRDSGYQLVAYLGLARETNQPARVDAAFGAILGAWLAQSLPHYMIPGTFITLPALPKLASGKIDRRSLPNPRELAPALVTEPESPLEERLVEIWRALLDRQAIDVHTDFFIAGGHSLLAIRLLAEIRESFGLDLPLTALFHAPTVRQLARQLEIGQCASVTSPLVPLRVDSEKPAIFCVHPVGGNVFCYLGLAKALARDFRFFGLQLPAIYGGESPRSFEEMAALYVDLIREAQPHGPYRLAGWSLGGLIAVEMARILSGKGAEVRWLGLFDTDPHPSPAAGEPDEANLLAAFAREFAAQAGIDLPMDASSESVLAEGLDSEAGKSLLRRVLPGMEPLQINRLWHAYRTMRNAESAFNPTVYQGPVTLFRATDGRRKDLAAAWRDLVNGDLTVQDAAGSHHGMFHQEHVQLLADQVRRSCVELDGEQNT